MAYAKFGTLPPTPKDEAAASGSSNNLNASTMRSTGTTSSSSQQGGIAAPPIASSSSSAATPSSASAPSTPSYSSQKSATMKPPGGNKAPVEGGELVHKLQSKIDAIDVAKAELDKKRAILVEHLKSATELDSQKRALAEKECVICFVFFFFFFFTTLQGPNYMLPLNRIWIIRCLLWRRNRHTIVLFIAFTNGGSSERGRTSTLKTIWQRRAQRTVGNVVDEAQSHVQGSTRLET